MASSESSSSILLWIGGILAAAGAVIIGGFWIYALLTEPEMPSPIILVLVAMMVGVAILLIAAIRDRIIHKKDENFLEVDN